MAFQLDVIIDVHPGLLPLRILGGCWGKRQHGQAVKLLESALPASGQFPEGALVQKEKAFTEAVLSSAIPIIWKFFLKPYQRQRVATFLNPENDPLGTGYHIIQSKIAVGSGLIFGKGYLQGTQGQLDFLPERHTDFAFSVWAEEWGFFGSALLIICYFFMILWGLNIAISARDKFGVLLAFGVVSLIFWQAFINLAMVMGLLPVVGVPLPLFSYGGSSLLTNLAGLGLLMNIRMRRYMGSS